MTQSNTRDKLFDSYSLRTDALDESAVKKIKWFDSYSKKNYFTYIKHKSKNSSVLDIGCNRGYLLHAFENLGFSNTVGIDLSENDLVYARSILNTKEIFRVDAFEYLKNSNEKFDIIIIKAVLEHIPKLKTEELISLMYGALKKDGVLIIDVPNMDWLFAGHERYMDFTHEVGFTKESMEQVISLYFQDYKIFSADTIILKSGLRKIALKITRFILQSLLKIADPEGGSSDIWHRSLITISTKK